ncbi:hypothetical protein [Diaphorobacter aerolatus]|uniref:Uncharacterized protein n=1 Tax=Diaphorobacter aerolatus TaxID=1288495 RepID=A0A7H0GJJ9_9BURK|nr:hypothetical protein [Diaphorobacter aerolatus]QNP48465.1 hypothetical protein H9K75_21460 [Diaphorobacter aerolatus]
MRTARSCPSMVWTTTMVLTLLAVGITMTANAQTPTRAASVTDANAPTRELTHDALKPSGHIVKKRPDDWRAANKAVAEFPRGHADVLRWEEAQGQGQAQTPTYLHGDGEKKPPVEQQPHQHHKHGARP